MKNKIFLLGLVLFGLFTSCSEKPVSENTVVESKEDTSKIIMAIFAHPDDETTIGPVLAKYAKDYEVYLVVATDGSFGVTDHSGIPAGDSLVNIRIKETECACEKLGINPPHFLGAQDGMGLNGHGNFYEEVPVLKERIKEKIEEYILNKNIGELMINYLFPLNDVFDRNYLREPDDYKFHFQNQRLGIQDYFYRYLEFKIGKNQVSDKIFKQVLKKLDTEKNYDNLKTFVDELKKYSSDNILRRLFLNIDQLSILGKKNMLKLLATEEYFLSRDEMDNPLWQTNIRFPMQVLKEFDDGKDIEDTLSYIARNNKNIYYVADFIEHAKHDLKTETGDAGFENELNKVQKHFIEELVKVDVAQFFDNAQDGKNATIFKYFEEYDKLEYLKEEILRYLEKDSKSIIVVLKSLINPVYAGFSGKKVYDKIDDKEFQRIEKYIDRINLIKALKRVNDVYNNMHLYEDKEISGLTDFEQIVIQYHRFIQDCT